MWEWDNIQSNLKVIVVPCPLTRDPLSSSGYSLILWGTDEEDIGICEKLKRKTKSFFDIDKYKIFGINYLELNNLEHESYVCLSLEEEDDMQQGV